MHDRILFNGLVTGFFIRILNKLETLAGRSSYEREIVIVF